jgi:poly-gamma-glutamate capsule biosynthesis protein CapA/YwtB (metallophosphatase superfamily)
VYLAIRGLRLAFLALDDVSAPINMEAARQVLAGMRHRSDVVFVSIHWGHEYRHAPGQRQFELAAALTAAGADLIWGHHPHVLQPIETIEVGGRQALVAWSLGNALFDQVAPPAARQSLVLLVSISHEGVIETTAIPFEIDPHRGTTRLITP